MGLLVVGGAMLAAGASPAHAQGFGLNEIGTCMVGRTSAGVALPCADGSGVFWNPASIVRLDGTAIAIGGAAVAVNGAFTADTTGIRYPGDVPIEYPPYAFATRKFGPRLAAGIGVYVPYGLTSQWEEDFPGRFEALKASLATIYVQPTVAFDIVPGRFSIGGGPIFGHSTVELRQSIDLSEQVAAVRPGNDTLRFLHFGVPRGTEFARAQLEGSSNAWGFQVGAQLLLTPTIAIGARYLSELQFEYDDADATFEPISTGDTLPVGNPINPQTKIPVDQLVAAQFETGGALVAQKVATSINHPAQFQVGLTFSGIERTRISLDYEWVGWSAFAELPVEFQGPASGSNRTLIEDYDDASIFRSSIEHDFLMGWQARAGFSFNRAPVPDETVTPLLPDMDRYVFAGGITLPIVGSAMLDASYLRVETPGRRGRVTSRTSREQTADQLNTGWYELQANIFSLGVRFRF